MTTKRYMALIPFFFFILLCVNANADDKVVVIPLGNSNKKIKAEFIKGSGKSLSTTSQIVTTATITASSPGTIIAHSSATITEGSNREIGCGIALDSTFNPLEVNYWIPGVAWLAINQITSFRHFDVAAGTHDVNQLCKITLGTGTSSLIRSWLSLQFIPH